MRSILAIALLPLGLAACGTGGNLGTDALWGSMTGNSGPGLDQQDQQLAAKGVGIRSSRSSDVVEQPGQPAQRADRARYALQEGQFLLPAVHPHHVHQRCASDDQRDGLPAARRALEPGGLGLPAKHCRDFIFLQRLRLALASTLVLCLATV